MSGNMAFKTTCSMPGMFTPAPVKQLPDGHLAGQKPQGSHMPQRSWPASSLHACKPDGELPHVSGHTCVAWTHLLWTGAINFLQFEIENCPNVHVWSTVALCHWTLHATVREQHSWWKANRSISTAAPNKDTEVCQYSQLWILFLNHLRGAYCKHCQDINFKHSLWTLHLSEWFCEWSEMVIWTLCVNFFLFSNRLSAKHQIHFDNVHMPKHCSLWQFLMWIFFLFNCCISFCSVKMTFPSKKQQTRRCSVGKTKPWQRNAQKVSKNDVSHNFPEHIPLWRSLPMSVSWLSENGVWKFLKQYGGKRSKSFLECAHVQRMLQPISWKTNLWIHVGRSRKCQNRLHRAI